MALEGDGIEAGLGGESVSEVSEEEQQRVRETIGRAKKVRTQIKQIQQQNKQFAVMLALLLQLIDDDVLLGNVFEQLVDYQVAIPAIFAQFLPMFVQQQSMDEWSSLYGDLRQSIPQQTTVTTLVAWFKQLRGSSKSLKEISLVKYVPFALRYLERYGIVDTESMDDTQKEELLDGIKEELG